MISLKKLKKYLDCDDEFVLRLLTKFLNESETSIEQINLWKNNRNNEVLSRAAHKLLSSTRILQLNELTEALERIQNLINEGGTVDEQQIERLIDTTNHSYANIREEIFGLKKELSE